MMLYQVLGIFGNTFSITDSEEGVPFIVVFSDCSGMEEREEVCGKLNGFS